MSTSASQKEMMTMAGLNLIQQALSVYDQDLRLVQSNHQFRAMFDLPPELVRSGARFEDTIRHLCSTGEYGPIDDLEEAVRHRVETARAFQPHYMERTRANGRIVSVEGAPLPQGGWVAVYTDITDTKRQEALLRARSEELSDQLLTRAEELSATNRQLQSANTRLEETRRELTEMEARIRLTTEMLPAHIAHVSPQRIYTYSNRRLSHILPGRPTHIAGMHVAEVLGQQAHQAVRPYLDAALEGRPAVFEFTDESSSRRIRTALTPNGSEGVYIMSMDITEESQTRAALTQTRRRELAAQVTSGMAHDFSNLLTIILGLQSQLVRQDLPDAARTLVAATQRAAKRGGDLLNRIAEMTGGREHNPGQTDWEVFIQDFETLARSTLPESVNLCIDNTAVAQRLWLDTGMLQDSLLNLVLNAGDAIGDGPGHIRIACSNLKDTWLQIRVSDSGPGFSSIALQKATEPFFTTKGNEGSGLGLSMVYDMTQRAGGRMRIANNAAGAEVTISLPWRDSPQLAAAGGLALLVEDSPDLRHSIRQMLVDAGYSVIEAPSTDEALEILATVEGLALVLSDLSLEGTATGIDLFDQLDQSAPPFLMMTSLRPDHPLHRAARVRGPVLQKPFDANQLRLFLRQRISAE